jgi:type VI secretion system protein ImpF
VDDLDPRITPSLLDRLTDHEPGIRDEPVMSRNQGLRALKAALWRDMNALLNTKRREEELPEQYVETTKSLLTFGIPDFTAYSLKSPGDQNRLRRAIEAAIRRFEPRLEKINVTIQLPDETDPSMRFRVDAFLQIEPAPEPVSFETVLPPGTSRFLIVGEDR